MQVEESLTNIGDSKDGSSAALRCLILDVIAPQHGRDYRYLSCFLLTHVRTLRNSRICAVEFNGNERRPAVYCFDPGNRPRDDSSPLSLLAHRGHVQWLAPPAESTPSLLRYWHLHFDKVRRGRSFDWGMFLRSNVIPMDVPSKLYNFRHCQENIKLGAPEHGFVGVNANTGERAPPDGSNWCYGREIRCDSYAHHQGREFAFAFQHNFIQWSCSK